MFTDVLTVKDSIDRSARVLDVERVWTVIARAERQGYPALNEPGKIPVRSLCELLLGKRGRCAGQCRRRCAGGEVLRGPAGEGKWAVAVYRTHRSGGRRGAALRGGVGKTEPPVGRIVRALF